MGVTGCRRSKIMSLLSCNETLSPCKGGDDESERGSPPESSCSSAHPKHTAITVSVASAALKGGIGV